MSPHRIERQIVYYTGYFTLFWTILVFVMGWMDISTIRQLTMEKALGEARANFNKDVSFRDWATSHGGVYVPATESTPPNKYLDVPERDLTTPSGKRLTLVNPAYMMRQLYENYGGKKIPFGHLTSLNLVNPVNKPDEWETTALKSFQKGSNEVYEISVMNGAPTMRLMRPLFITKGCLKCHGKLGYKEGDLRGGISISVQMEDYYAVMNRDIGQRTTTLGLIWFIGLAGILGGATGIRKQAARRVKVEEELLLHKEHLEEEVKARTVQLHSLNVELRAEVAARMESAELLKKEKELARTYLDEADVIFVIIGRDQTVTLINRKGCEVLGYAESEIIGANWFDKFVPQDQRDSVKNVFNKIFSGELEPVKRYENEVISKDGKRKLIAWNNAMIRGEEGSIISTVSAGVDITEKTMAEKALKDSEMKYRTLVETAEDGITLTDTSFNRIYGNKASAAQLGYTDDEMDTLDSLSIIHPGDVAEVKRSMEETLHKGSASLEYRILRKDGQWMVRSAKSSVIYGDKGEPAAVLSITRDITNLKRKEEELRRAKEIAEEATKVKDKFVSLVSHDLKGPVGALNGLLGFIKHDLESEGGHQKTLRTLDAAILSAKNMAELITDLLSVSRVKSGHIAIKGGFVDGHKLAVEAIAGVSHLAATKTIQLVNSVPPGSRMYGDANLLSEVMRNFMSNAIKFTPAGGKVSVFVPEGRRGCLAVRDNGVGISDEVIPHLFKYEEKTTTIGTAGEKGTGLGLPLCNDIVKAHGGAIIVESEKGEGSTFYLSLPDVKPRVLVVDDDPASLYLFNEYIGETGAEVKDSKDSVSAIAIIRGWKPHVILMDVKLSEPDGGLLIEKLWKDQSITQGASIIATSSEMNAETASRAKILGAVEVIEKPFAKEELLDKIRSITV